MSERVDSRIALNQPQAAASLGVSERTIRRWTKDGKIPHRKIGSVVLYPVKALQEWANGDFEQSTERTQGGAVPTAGT